jgi:acetolactate decarboxylase
MLKGILAFSAITIFLSGCSNLPQTPKVQHSGALRSIMHKGDISSKVELSILDGKKNIYALGALGNLKGEVQILNSRPLSTYVSKEGKLKFDKSYSKSATLLVYAQVPSWESYKIPNDIKTRTQFEKYLEQQAKTHGIDLNHAFPFLIEGKLKMNSWHVINWDSSDTVHTHQKHIESGIHKKSKNMDVAIMLGFYSQNHVGVFTHHTTNMHIHFVSKDQKAGGHSDDMILGSGMILKLPAVR